MTAVTAAASVVAWAAAPEAGTIAAIDLSSPFATISAWRFTASQGPDIDDPIGLSGEKAPGAVQLCLRKGVSGPCDSQLKEALAPPSQDNPFAQPHYLNKARVVRQASGRSLLLVQTASLHAVDGGQLVLTQALAYGREADRFTRVYDHVTGTNNNEEVRYIESGRLNGDIISVDPTENAPFGYWISVNAPASPSAYKEVLHYRSATRYGDGNPLAVIDSEMPNIEARLGLWRRGSPLPLPAGRCLAPHLIRMELWCG